MSRTLLLVGTRKGAFLLESDADRRDWSIRGPYCEGWPVYHAVYDQGSGSIYAAAASEWHGSAVWHSGDLGETWAHSSDGLSYGEDGKRMSKVSSLAAAHGRVLVGVEAPGIFESKDRAQTWSLLSTLAGEPGSDEWDDPANQPPGHLGLSALMPDEKTSRGSGRSCRASASSRRPTTVLRGRRATADCVPSGRGRTTRSASASTSSSALRSTPTGCTSRTTAACTAATTVDTRGSRSPRASRPTSASPRRRIRTTATRSMSSRSIRATAVACPTAKRRSGGRATPARAGRRSTAGCPPRTRTSGSCARGWRSIPTTRPASISGQHGAALRQLRRGRVVGRDRGVPAGDLVRRGRDHRLAVAELYLPSTLTPLFAGLPRRLEIDASTVDEAIGDARGAVAWRPRPSLRARPAAPHAHPRLRRPRARDACLIDRGALAGRCDLGDQRRLSAAPLRL